MPGGKPKSHSGRHKRRSPVISGAQQQVSAAESTKVSLMFVDIAVQRDLISFRRDWARWSAGERLVEKTVMLLTLVAVLSILGQAA